MKEIHEKIVRLRSTRTAVELPRKDVSVFVAGPSDQAKIRGGIVLVQEIFGVNAHIRSLARRYAQEGLLVFAPAYFDHFEPGIELNYDAEGMTRGRNLVERLGWEQALEDTRECATTLRLALAEASPTANSTKNVAVIGFCWGGSLAWLSACRLDRTFDAAICYYGRQTWDFRNESPAIPVIMHFGQKDPSIPMQKIEEFKQAQPRIPVYIYDAGHGFNCEERADFAPESARLAHSRSQDFLKSMGL